MKYIKKNGKLQDQRIVDAMRKAADVYEDGAIIEAADMLLEVINAIYAFASREES